MQYKIQIADLITCTYNNNYFYRKPKTQQQKTKLSNGAVNHIIHKYFFGKDTYILYLTWYLKSHAYRSLSVFLLLSVFYRCKYTQFTLLM